MLACVGIGWNESRDEKSMTRRLVRMYGWIKDAQKDGNRRE